MRLQFRLLLLIFIATANVSVAQLSYGRVKKQTSYCKAKSNCNCDSAHRVGSICNSRNDMEVRLSYTDLNKAHRLFTLGFDSSGKWYATLKLDTILYREGHRTIFKEPSTYYRLIPDTDFETIFDQLKKNKIYKLENNYNYTGGGLVSLEYKAGNKFRHYLFTDPGKTMPTNQVNVDAAYYFNIMDIFIHHFNFERLNP